MRLSNKNYSNRIIDNKPSIWLQEYGWCQAKPANEFQPGEFMKWNTGAESKVLSTVKQTAKTITYSLEWKDYFGYYKKQESKFLIDRWVAIGSGENY